MPGFDKTGPNGLGPRTGRGFGPCGYGQRGGMGYGRGCDWGYRAPITSQQEKEMLTENMDALQKEMDAIKARIKELGSKK